MERLSEHTITLARRREITELIRSGRYDEVNYLIKDGVNKRRLTLQDEPPGERSLVLVGADDGISTIDMLKEIRELGLMRPSYADALLMGEQHPEEQCTGPIVFLHEPPYSWSGHFFYMVLDTDKKGRSLSFVSSGGWWHSGFRFAFRRRA